MSHNLFLVGREGPSFGLNCQLTRKANTHFTIRILCQVKCYKYCYKGNNCKIFLGLQRSPDYRTVFEKNETYSPMPWCKQSKEFFPICYIFPIIDHCNIFLLLVGSDNLMNGFEDCIIFVIRATWVSFNFCL